jgi:hypothetical protein
MSPYLAYFLGLITVLVILLPFWVLSMRFRSVSGAYKSLFCNQAI